MSGVTWLVVPFIVPLLWLIWKVGLFGPDSTLEDAQAAAIREWEEERRLKAGDARIPHPEGERGRSR